jgi:hypothetical protein
MDKQDLTSADPCATGGRRRTPATMEHLHLRELDPADVFDQPNAQLLPLLTFGAMRETCPHCTGQHLRLILRQESVRIAHLLCQHCHACFDAHYADGRCALSI